MAEEIRSIRVRAEIDTNKRTLTHDTTHDTIDDAGMAFAEFVRQAIDPDELAALERLECVGCGFTIDLERPHVVIEQRVESRRGGVTTVHDVRVASAMHAGCDPELVVDGDRYRWGSSDRV